MAASKAIENPEQDAPVVAAAVDASREIDSQQIVGEVKREPDVAFHIAHAKITGAEQSGIRVLWIGKPCQTGFGKRADTHGVPKWQESQRHIIEPVLADDIVGGQEEQTVADEFFFAIASQAADATEVQQVLCRKTARAGAG